MVHFAFSTYVYFYLKGIAHMDAICFPEGMTQFLLLKCKYVFTISRYSTLR